MQDGIKLRSDFGRIGQGMGSLIPVMVYDWLKKDFEGFPDICTNAINGFYKMFEKAAFDSDYSQRLASWINRETSTIALRDLWEDATGCSYWSGTDLNLTRNAVNFVDTAKLRADTALEVMNGRPVAMISASLGASAFDILDYAEDSFAAGFCAAKFSELKAGEQEVFWTETSKELPSTRSSEQAGLDVLFGSGLERLAAYLGANEFYENCSIKDAEAFSHGFCLANAYVMTRMQVDLYTDSLADFRARRDLAAELESIEKEEQDASFGFGR
jgi:hypothetical protein